MRKGGTYYDGQDLRIQWRFSPEIIARQPPSKTGFLVISVKACSRGFFDETTIFDKGALHRYHFLCDRGGP